MQAEKAGHLAIITFNVYEISMQANRNNFPGAAPGKKRRTSDEVSDAKQFLITAL